MESTPIDPTVDEIREVRRQISARFNNDPARLVEHYLRFQEQFRERLLGTANVDNPTGSPAQTRANT